MTGNRSILPQAAEDEVLELLFANMEIGADETAAILKKHKVAADPELLQERYRRQLGQRLMASLRDDAGRREVFSDGRGRYFVLACCRDRQQLKSIRRRIQGQMRGLNSSAVKVQTRLTVLDRLIARFRGVS